MTTSALATPGKTKSFATADVLSVFLDARLSKETTLDSLQECISWCVGRHIWTHSMARKVLWDDAADALLRAYPSLSDYAVGTPASWETLEALIERAVSEFGEEMSVSWGGK